MVQVRTEEDTRNELARVAIRMRHCRQERQALDAEWLTLVTARIELQDRLDRYEVAHIGYVEDTA